MGAGGERPGLFKMKHDTIDKPCATFNQKNSTTNTWHRHQRRRITRFIGEKIVIADALLML
jgi:hypothetical protein